MKKSIPVQELESIIAAQKATIESLLKVIESISASWYKQVNPFTFTIPSIPAPAPPVVPYIGDSPFGPFGSGTITCGAQEETQVWQATNRAPTCQIGQNQ